MIRELPSASILYSPAFSLLRGTLKFVSCPSFSQLTRGVGFPSTEHLLSKVSPSSNSMREHFTSGPTKKKQKQWLILNRWKTIKTLLIFWSKQQYRVVKNKKPTHYILTVNYNFILLWRCIKLWSFWPQIHVCLTSERDSVVVSSHSIVEDRWLIHWILISTVKSVCMDHCIAFVPSHCEVLHRCYMVDVTWKPRILIFLEKENNTLRATARADADVFWECWRKQRLSNTIIISFCSMLNTEIANS